MGRVYQRGNIWWLQYYGQGQLFRESSRSDLKSAAISLLKLREGEIRQGHIPALKAQKTTFEDLADLYLQDYRINGRRTCGRAQELTDRLRESFGCFRACLITSQHILTYIARRQSQGIANGTINRELAALKRMFRLARRQTPPLVVNTLHIPHLQENNVRQGFFTEEEYRLLLAVLPAHVKILLIVAYWTGMRAGEIVALRWDQVDIERGKIRLEPGTTKNNKGRSVPLVPELAEALWQWKKHTLNCHLSCPWVCHYKGRQLVRVPKRAWKTACERIGLKGKLFHDLRRTAVRNMIRAQITERVAMAISGHKTRSVFDRYDIVNEADLSDAVMKLENGKILARFQAPAVDVGGYHGINSAPDSDKL